MLSGLAVGQVHEEFDFQHGSSPFLNLNFI
jgi:hypothetical protein